MASHWRAPPLTPAPLSVRDWTRFISWAACCPAMNAARCGSPRSPCLHCGSLAVLMEALALLAVAAAPADVPAFGSPSWAVVRVFPSGLAGFMRTASPNRSASCWRRREAWMTWRKDRGAASETVHGGEGASGGLSPHDAWYRDAGEGCRDAVPAAPEDAAGPGGESGVSAERAERPGIAGGPVGDFRTFVRNLDDKALTG